MARTFEGEGIKGEDRTCKFCGCRTNAFLRACCELGRTQDLARVTPEQCARWEKEAEQWLVESNEPARELGKMISDLNGVEKAGLGSLVRMLAGRILCLLDEIARLRRDRDGLKMAARAASRIGEVKRFMEAYGYGGYDDDPMKKVLTILMDESWFYVDGVRYCSVCGTRGCSRQGGTFRCGESEESDHGKLG